MGRRPAGLECAAMDDLFRLTDPLESDPRLEEWFDAVAGELGDLAREWFARLRACGDDVLELLHDDQATALVEDVPFAYVGAYKAHVSVGFFRGAHLDDPAGLLEGSGKSMRHVKLRPGKVVDAPALHELVEAAYRDIQARLGRS